MTTDSLRSALGAVRAYLFDLDGVITPTADVHRRAWAALFGPEFEAHGGAPYTEADYYEHIDGKPRFDGVRDALASRGIVLPEGTHEDAPTLETVGGLGNRKNALFNELLDREGVRPYAGSLDFLAAVESFGLDKALITSSRNGRKVLQAAGLAEHFEIVVDGVRAAELGLAGKPDPATYLRAAAELNVPNRDCAVIEDAVSGVAAGAAGGFGLVIGVDRGVGRELLLENGADIVIDDLAELVGPLEQAMGR